MQVRRDRTSLVQGVKYFRYPAGEMSYVASTTILEAPEFDTHANVYFAFTRVLTIMGDGGEDPHLVYAAGGTSYPKKLRRYFIGTPRYFGEVTAASQRLDDGLDPNIIWIESDCPEEKDSPWPSDCRWQSFNIPLHQALRISDIASAELLLSRGANINIHNANSLTPLHESVWRLKHNDIRFLIERGCDLNAVTIVTRNGSMTRISSFLINQTCYPRR